MQLANRFFQLLLIVSTLGGSWLTMMIVHEGGHAFNAWVSGGRVARVILHPLSFSRTDLAENPHPLWVAWGGAVWGVILPLFVWAVMSKIGKRYAFLARWFAGFCLIANGAYLGAGSFFPGGGDDAGVILQLGGAFWSLFLFGIVSITAGLACWNGLGSHFGFGRNSGPKVDRSAAVGMTTILIFVIVITCLFSGR